MIVCNSLQLSYGFDLLCLNNLVSGSGRPKPGSPQALRDFSSGLTVTGISVSNTVQDFCIGS